MIIFSSKQWRPSGCLRQQSGNILRSLHNLLPRSLSVLRFLKFPCMFDASQRRLMSDSGIHRQDGFCLMPICWFLTSSMVSPYVLWKRLDHLAMGAQDKRPSPSLCCFTERSSSPYSRASTEIHSRYVYLVHGERSAQSLPRICRFPTFREPCEDLHTRI